MFGGLLHSTPADMRIAGQEESGHVDAPCEWWGLEVSAARATLGQEVGVYAAMR